MDAFLLGKISRQELLSSSFDKPLSALLVMYSVLKLYIASVSSTFDIHPWVGESFIRIPHPRPGLKLRSFLCAAYEYRYKHHEAATFLLDTKK